MAQQVFPQWSPVVRAHNEDQQEVYIPAAIIHAQTRDGKDELIVGAANMQFDPGTGDYLPTHAGNPVEVRARALETLLQTLGKEETLALIKAALDALVSKDFATQTTLVAVLEKLADLATESTLEGVKSAVDALAGTVDAGAQKVTLTGHTVDMATESTLSSLASAVAKETTLAQVLSALGALATETTLGGVKSAVDTLAGTVDAGVQKVALSGQNVEILAEYQGYTEHNPQAPSARYFGATAGTLTSVQPLDVRRFGGLVLKLTNGYNVAVTHRVVAFKAGEPGSPIWVDVTEDADLPAGAEFVYEIPNRYPYIALRVHAPARDQTGENGLDVDIVGSVFYA